MAVLSDKAILEKFEQLIDSGIADRVRGCTYSFVPGKIFPSQRHRDSAKRKVIDWASKAEKDWPGEETYDVCPGELVTLRTRETVSMPVNLCGIWNQTDGLSRKGLLLVNISTVPPGYEGHLTCTVVNFGKQRVRLSPSTRVAKLMFLALDQDAVHASKSWPNPRYDSDMAAMASTLPATFLQVSDQSRKLARLLADGEVRIEKIVEDLVADARKKVAADAAAERDELKKNIASDTRAALLKASPLAVLAIALVAFGQWVATNFLTSNVESVAKQRADQIEAKIDKQLEAARTKPVFVYSGTEESKVLLERMKALEAEMNEMKSEKK